MSSISSINSYFTNLLESTMSVETEPLEKLKLERDTLSVKSSVYTDVRSKLKDLQDAIKVLKSTASTPSLVSGRTLSISDLPDGYTVFKAASSKTAVTGKYSLTVNTLARESRVRSDQQLYSDQALNFSGTILLGGEAVRRIGSFTNANTMVTGSTASSGETAIADGTTELGTGKYYVETRLDGTTKQFRLVDAEGNAVSILEKGSTDKFTSSWQTLTDGEVNTIDTGRGLKLTLDGSASFTPTSREATAQAGQAATIDYVAQGVSLSITVSDTLNSIASKINGGKYAQGNGITATVVDRQLVLSTTDTGAGRKIYASGQILSDLGILGDDNQSGANDLGAADGFKHTLQEARDASFVVNGMTVTRSKNSSLTDVISGVTLDLAADAEGRSGTIAVNTDWSGAKGALNTFLSKFNDALTYLQGKTGVENTSTGDTVSYTRGALADDNIFYDLRSNLLMKFSSNVLSSGRYKGLRDIGLKIDDNLSATIEDSEALEDALNNHFDDVVALMDAASSSFDTELARFTGNSDQDGYIRSASSSLQNQLTELDNSIESMESRLVDRRAYYASQYAEMQAQLINLMYSQQTWQSIYGQTNQSA